MIVLDTHTWLWWVSDPSRLSRRATKEIRSAKRIGVCAISCLEVAVAVARGRISLDRDTLEWIDQALGLPRMELLPLSPAVAVKAAQLDRGFPGDPADRIIVATAILEAGFVVTKDAGIRRYAGAPAVW